MTTYNHEMKDDFGPDVYVMYEEDDGMGVYCATCGMHACGIDHKAERQDAVRTERNAMREAGVNPDVWEIHDAYCLYGPDKSLRDMSLVRRCGSLHDARRGVKAIARRGGESTLLYDIRGPREVWARKVGFIPKELATFRKGA